MIFIYYTLVDRHFRDSFTSLSHTTHTHTHTHILHYLLYCTIYPSRIHRRFFFIDLFLLSHKCFRDPLFLFISSSYSILFFSPIHSLFQIFQILSLFCPLSFYLFLELFRDPTTSFHSLCPQCPSLSSSHPPSPSPPLPFSRISRSPTLMKRFQLRISGA